MAPSATVFICIARGDYPSRVLYISMQIDYYWPLRDEALAGSKLQLTFTLLNREMQALRTYHIRIENCTLYIFYWMFNVIHAQKSILMKYYNYYFYIEK